MNYLLVPLWLFQAISYTAVALALAAGVTLAMGFLAARRGWEPRCRACAHDLRSVDPSKGACPECGADLTKAGAVQAGRRRVRPVVATLGVVLLVLAGLAAWKLDAAGVRAWRARLIDGMPTQPLVDALFEGGEQVPLVRAALQRRTESGNAERALPSGALLDAVLAAADRCDEPGRRPLSAALQSDVQYLLSTLDPAERARLVELATEELIASGGATMSKYQIALSTRSAGAEGGELADAVVDRLATTPEGRRVLAMRLYAPPVLATGATERISLSEALPRSRTRFGAGDSQGQMGFVFGEAWLDAIDGSIRRPLASVAGERTTRLTREAPGCTLLIDAPPGKYRLTVRGVLAKSVLLPRSSSVFEPAPAISIEDASKLEGAMPFDGSVEVEVGSPALAEREFTENADAIERAARALGRCRIASQGGRARIDLDALANLGGKSGANPAERAPALSMMFFATQGGRRWSLGAFSMAGSSYSSGMGELPESLNLSEPFELVAEPLTAWNARHTGARVQRSRSGSRDGDAFVWATFAIRFESATKEPAVTVTRMPLVESTGSGRTDEAARKAVENWAATLTPGGERRMPRMPRGGSSPIARTISLAGAMTYDMDADGNTTVQLGFEWPRELCLSGWIELRSGERLATGAVPAFGLMGDGGALPRDMTPAIPVGDDEPLVVRYTPDAQVGRADASGPFAFLALPFEVRFPSATAKPELVWLDGAPSRVEEGKTP